MVGDNILATGQSLERYCELLNVRALSAKGCEVLPYGECRLPGQNFAGRFI
jgi:hypothetical protein